MSDDEYDEEAGSEEGEWEEWDDGERAELELTYGDSKAVCVGACSNWLDNMFDFGVIILLLLWRRSDEFLTLAVVEGVGWLVQCCTLIGVKKVEPVFLPFYIFGAEACFFVIQSFELGNKTWSFVTIRVLHAFLTAVPMCLLQGYLLLTLESGPAPEEKDPNVPDFGDDIARPVDTSGEDFHWVREGSLFMSVTMITEVIIFEFRTREAPSFYQARQRFFILKAIELVYTWCETAVSLALWVFAWVVHGPSVMMFELAIFYGALVVTWRWWAPQEKRRKEVFIFSCIMSIPNLLGAYATGGDSCTSYVYACPCGPLSVLPGSAREFLRNGVWLPDFLGLLLVRDVAACYMLALMWNTGLTAADTAVGVDVAGYWYFMVSLLAAQHFALAVYATLWGCVWTDFGAKSNATKRPGMKRRVERRGKISRGPRNRARRSQALDWSGHQQQTEGTRSGRSRLAAFLCRFFRCPCRRRPGDSAIAPDRGNPYVDREGWEAPPTSVGGHSSVGSISGAPKGGASHFERESLPTAGSRVASSSRGRSRR